MTSTIAELFDPKGLGKSIDQADSPNYAVQKILIKLLYKILSKKTV